MRSVGFLILLAGGCNREKPAPALPTTIPSKSSGCNLVFISFDAVQAAHVGALGYQRNTTPNIDAIAKQSFSFENAISVASWTVPASMSWFTGVYPSEHRMTNKFAVYNRDVKKPAKLKELSPDLVTLAEILKQNGYSTGGFTGNAGVSGGFGYELGFDIYDCEPGKFGSFDRSIPKALEWLAANKDKKFFLFLHGYDAHGQNTPASGYDFRYVDRNYDRKYFGTELEQEILREEGLDRGRLTLRETDVRFWRALYDEKISRLDLKFQHFMESFERLGVSDRTLFVLTSDHGTELYEHGRLDHGFTLYNETLHVPLFIRLPGQTAGRTIPDRVSSIDLMPTILELMDVQVGENGRRQLRGTSLVPVMNGGTAAKDIFSETDYRQYTYKRSIITPDGWKLIYTLESRSRELYFLNDDPGEMKNLAPAEKPRADMMEQKLFEHFAKIGHDLNGKLWQIGMNPVYSSQGR